MENRIIVAGGGGGADSYSSYRWGGAGGGLNGQNSGGDAPGGTQSSGGSPASNGAQEGSFGHGGDGFGSAGDGHGCGGGGGWYGGAGGQHSSAGGGGGSSYIDGVENGFTESGVNEGHGLVQITYTTTSSYVYSEEQQVARGTVAEVPIRLNADTEIDGLTFAVEVSPNGGINSISEDLSIETLIPGSDALITQTGDGMASLILSDLGSIAGEDVILANLLITIPEGTLNGDTYALSFTAVSGSTADYEDVEMIDYLNTTLTVITGPPEIDGLVDVYMLENSAVTLGFNVSDLDGTEISMELTEAPDYVTLNYNTGEGSGSIDIAPGYGVESGLIVVTATNSEPVPESVSVSFMVYINHYPVFEPTETVYLLEGDETGFEVSLTDSDGDTVTLSLQSAPDYVSYEPYDENSGYIEINSYMGAVSGDVVFDISDDGSPPAVTTSGFTVILNHNPEIYGLSDFHVPENDVLDTLITFSDFDEDPLSFEILEAPGYLSYEVYGDNDGLALSIAPGSDDVSGTFTLLVTDPGGMSVEQSVSITVYETYLAGDVRPVGNDLNADGDSEDAGEFGNDHIYASDVINTLKVSTGAEEYPDSSSSLHDAFDSSPLDSDVNGDGDVYDLGERGGDGYIDAGDVIISLLRATMVPGYENIRRVDNNYPYSSRYSDRDNNRQDPTDMLVLGDVEASSGEIVHIPVTLVRGESESVLTSLVSGFSLTHESGLELPEELEFIEQVECMKMDASTGNNILSLRMKDIGDQAPGTEILLGHIAFTVPEDAIAGDIFTLSSQRESGSTSSYESILFLEGTASTVTITASSVSGDINFDGTVNVQDIMVMINIILPPGDDNTDEALQAADLNGDGLVNILDVMIVVNIILPDDMGRVAPADKATLYFGNNSVSYNANGAVAGFQLEVAGEYEITNSALPEGWKMHYNEGIVVIFSMDGSSLENSTLFEYTGNMTIESIIVSDIEGNAIPASSVIVPSKYALESAYPNPFNPVTTLNLSLPESQEVILQVYNLQGQVIETLINGNMEAGYHTLQWNADNHASGVYFVKMVAGEFVNTQKLMLVK
jgi:hypothetical protein